MECAITPSRQKLDSKGIKSVRQRVANLKDLGVDFGFDGLMARITEYFCDGSQFLTKTQLADVLEIEKSYLDECFIKYGRRN